VNCPACQGHKTVIQAEGNARCWKCGWQKDRRDADAIRRGLEEAGLLVGLGSFRPENGRFIVTEWRVDRA